MNWTEGGSVVSTSPSYTFTATGNRSLVANFSAITYTVNTSSSPSGGGTTSGGGTHTCSSSVTVTATPTSCYNFVNWTEGGSVVSTSPSYTFTASANRNLVADFVVISHTINTSSSPLAGGSTTGGGAKTCGSSVTVTATPNSGYSFMNWTEGATVVSTSSRYTFTATSNRNLVANFVSTPTYIITATASLSNAGATSGSGNYTGGQSATVTATVTDSCYFFVNWTEGGTIVSTSPSYTFAVNGNRDLVANFSLFNYSITTASSPATGGTTTGGGTNPCGSSVTVAAAPNPGYAFLNWTEAGSVVRLSPTYSFAVSSNRNLVANFSSAREPQPTVTCMLSGQEVIVAWAVQWTNWVLESCNVLAPSTTWSQVPSPSAIVGNVYVVTNDISAPTMFYRLRSVPAPFPAPSSDLVWIRPGSFVMGSPLTEAERGADEAQHTVTLTKGFFMGRFLVTQGEYLSRMNANPSSFTGDTNRPVEQVSWFDATNYCVRLTQQEQQAGRLASSWAYRLPTEAEWEYACRAGTITAFHLGSALRSGMQNFNGHYEYDSSVGSSYNSGGILLYTTTIGGTYAPNAWGLFDMHGNLWEWCQDWYGSYPLGFATDPQGPASGSSRTARGGGWSGNGRYCRSAYRGNCIPTTKYYNIGFRVVLAQSQP